MPPRSPADRTLRVAVDVGGTFIDFVASRPGSDDVLVEKLAARGDLSDRLLEGIATLCGSVDAVESLVHGSTMVLNTIVQERGARVGLITTAGFRDVLELGRGNRAEIYNLMYKPAPPLVPRHLRIEVAERVAPDGGVVTPLDREAVAEAACRLQALGCESVAICFLHAYANVAHEREAAAIVRNICPGLLLSLSSDIVRERREFERTSTTVLNSYVQPRMDAYLSRLLRRLDSEGFQGVFSVMQSTGGVTTAETAQRMPIRVVQSGPAGGVIGAQQVSDALGGRDLVVADLGGTTFDVSIVRDGRFADRSEVTIGGRPILQPSIDIVSIGAGGGSIASLDAEGGLKVGPESAQADPGPVCYGSGGTSVTLTDALAVLGFFDRRTYLGGRLTLDVEAAREAIVRQIASPLGLAPERGASGILQVATANMVNAIRRLTIERGLDPRTFSMLCIGGGSGLFVGALLEEMQFRSVLVPPNPAVFSAWGLLQSDYRQDVSQSYRVPLAVDDLHRIGQLLEAMESEARDALAGAPCGAVRVERALEMRYLGQNHALTLNIDAVPSADAATVADLKSRFDAAHRRAYAHDLAHAPVEITVLRLSAIGEVPKSPSRRIAAAIGPAAPAGLRPVVLGDDPAPVPVPVYARDALAHGHVIGGPALVEEWSTTVVVLPGQRCRVDVFGNLEVEKA